MRTVARMVFLLLLPFSLVTTAMAAANHVPVTYAGVENIDIPPGLIHRCQTSVFDGTYLITDDQGKPTWKFKRDKTVFMQGSGFTPHSCFRYEVRQQFRKKDVVHRAAVYVGSSGSFFEPIWFIPSNAETGRYKVSFFWDDVPPPIDVTVESIKVEN
ncbi:MAG: hypothetical protein QJR00_03780 [Bacillota bacterium]|nr:hypothetical protein [Bacillota bacterium]